MSLPSKEQWRPVPGYEGRYEVSDHGRVRTLLRDGTRQGGGLLKPVPDQQGYRTVNLYKDRAYRRAKVHALVASAWHGPRPAGQVCRHLNDDKLDNRPENLAWGTRSENHLDAVRNGIHYLAKRDACGKGHAWTPENTRHLRRRGRTYRDCRRCASARDRAVRARRRAERLNASTPAAAVIH